MWVWERWDVWNGKIMNIATDTMDLRYPRGQWDSLQSSTHRSLSLWNLAEYSRLQMELISLLGSHSTLYFDNIIIILFIDIFRIVLFYSYLSSCFSWGTFYQSSLQVLLQSHCLKAHFICFCIPNANAVRVNTVLALQMMHNKQLLNASSSDDSTMLI